MAIRIKSNWSKTVKREKTSEDIASALSYIGWKCWLDEYEIYGNIDACMANGIENCNCVLVFITESYCNKINEAARNPNIRDNCYKEWNYANNRNKLIFYCK